MSAKSKKELVSTYDEINKILIQELEETYWLQKSIYTLLNMLHDTSTTVELKSILITYKHNLKSQIVNSKKLFPLINTPQLSTISVGKSGLIKEAKNNLKNAKDGLIKDAVIIVGCLKLQHYILELYLIMQVLCTTLGWENAIIILQNNIDVEKSIIESFFTLQDIQMSAESMGTEENATVVVIN
jgi:ferritin-like metal-binding protein YciE